MEGFAGEAPAVEIVASGLFILGDAAIALAAEAPEEFYSPLQNRDTSGRFGRGGGMGVTPGQSVPTRQPGTGGKNTTGAETTQWSEISAAGKQKMLDRLHHVGAPGLQGAKTPEAAIEIIERNILEVHDAVAPHNAAGWKQWYVGANGIARDMAVQYSSVSRDAAAAIIARMSPQKDWDQNVAQAHSTIDALHNDWKITPDVAARVAVLKAEAAVRAGTVTNNRSQLNLDPHEHMGLVGKKLSELTTEQAAFAIRANDPNPANKAVRVNPDGTYHIAEDTTGRPKTAWQSYETIQSAVRLFRDQSSASISTELGQEHKVRSFFNNISDPHSARHDVTIDTHAYGVGLGIPVGTSHPLIGSGKQNITGTGGNVSDGIRGTYTLFAEAYRRAAAERGLEPREMQSVTWEQWRHAYPKQSRARGAVALTEAAAVKYDAAIASGTAPAAARAELEKARVEAQVFASKYVTASTGD